MSSHVAGSALDFIRHRDRYLTRQQAAERVEVNKRTIDKYIRNGLPVYRVLGSEYVHIDELLAMWRIGRIAQNTTRALPRNDA